MGNKKSVSPVIATILLIAIVIVLALIVFLWARGLVPEVIQKKGMSTEQACQQVNLEVEYVGEELQVTNIGNIAVYKFEVRKKSGGNVEVQEENKPLAPGQSEKVSIGSYDKVEVVPVILGETEEGKNQMDICENNLFAAE